MKICEVQIKYEPKYKVSELDEISHSLTAYSYALEFWKDIMHIERFYVLLLNRSNKVLGYKMISQGGICGTVVDMKIIFQTALKANASAIMLIHNHPSGNLSPSKPDIDITKKVKSGCKILQLTLLDHLIISKEGYYSFTDEGI